ncbi:hypothetical protein EJ02DRAFT_363886 [Clathrospora elynae]|uniref:Uncharacterized protein n=1 Tax=Clathrospora elynae TaxID=706981 RepID=A0A6A5T3Z1_9PLEO|nr:hypothetical protein EJ02DRAFT_363886 [Clathrospora elynae]
MARLDNTFDNTFDVVDRLAQKYDIFHVIAATWPTRAKRMEDGIERQRISDTRNWASQEVESHNGGGDEKHAPDGEGTKNGSSIATSLRQSHGRQRKGSLRKAAMSSLRKERVPSKPPTITTTMSADSPDDEADLPCFNHESLPLNTTLDSGWLPASNFSESTSAVRPYVSTTDEDDALSFYRPSASSSASSFNGPTQNPAMSLSRRRSNRSDRRTSLTPVQTPADMDHNEEWDYSETEWWGWVVLVVTWAVFVVGMGSCLGVWSWAWDVGETPYAPPDLEDDATLPITGYYPALIVCTAVMSWVWVVVAWVGMKYFRHAKVGVDG